MPRTLLRAAVVAAGCLCAAACAGKPSDGPDVAAAGGVGETETEAALADNASAMADTGDPWQGYNRRMYIADKWLDRNILDPVAGAYNAVLPEFLRNRFTNIFALLGEPLNLAHNMFQGEGERSARVLSRILLNSTVGLGGMFDVAGRNGIDKANEDAGQTLAVWGVPSGPYVMLPFFGPSTVRGAFGQGVDILADPVQMGIDSRFGVTGADLELVNTGLGAGNAINTRARLDSQVDQIYGIEDIDSGYSLMRSGYLQSRCFAIVNNRLGARCTPEEDDPFEMDLDDMRRVPD